MESHGLDPRIQSRATGADEDRRRGENNNGASAGAVNVQSSHDRSGLMDIKAPEPVREILEHWGERAPGLEGLLTQYIVALLEANRQHNLTGDRDPMRQWLRHVGDALVCARLIEQTLGAPGEGARILDVGSGGGVPGLVWAIIWPRTRVHLLEATEKKARFLEQTALDLGLDNVRVITERAEKVGHGSEDRESYDWVTARALAVLANLAEWTVHFAKVGGYVLAIKGCEIDAELKASRRAFRILGVPTPPRFLPYTRPDGTACQILVYQKTHRTPSPYPRRASVATKSPL